MRFRREISGLLLLLPMAFLAFFTLRDNFVFPYLDVLKLNSEKYVQEIKTQKGQHAEVKNKVVWNSRRLEVSPPNILPKDKMAQRVLAADPNTWVDINLSSQTLCLFHAGGTNCFAVSTGMPWTPTPVGTFYIWIKLSSTKMSGPGYYLPGVPWTMYFYKGYGIHGTYWHNNFGHPMSHGCVNMRTPEAKFVFDRVSVGTRVVVHY